MSPAKKARQVPARRPTQKQIDAELDTVLLAISEALQAAMRRDNISGRRLAELMDADRSQVSALLNGRINMTVRTLVRITSALGYDVDVKLKRKEASK